MANAEVPEAKTPRRWFKLSTVPSPGAGAIVAAILLTLFTAIPLLPAYRSPISAQDEGLLLVYPQLVMKGEIPNRDFLTLYGPGNFWVLAASYSLFGLNLGVERTVGLLYHFGIVLAIFALTYRWGRAVAWGSGAIAGVLLSMLGLVAHSWFGAICLILWAMWFASRALETSEAGAHRNLVLAGALAGCALLYRPDAAPAAILALAPLIPSTRKARLFYAAGWGVGLLLLAGHVALASPARVFDNLVIEPIFRIAPGRRLPITQNLGETILLVVSTLTHLFAGALEIKSNSNRAQARLLLSFGLLSLLLLPQALQRADNTHFFYVSCVIIALLPVTIKTLALRFQNQLAYRRLIKVTGFVLIAGSLAHASKFLGNIAKAVHIKHNTTFPFTYRGRTVTLSSEEEVQETGELLRAVARFSAARESVFVGPLDLRRTNYNDTFLYYLLPDLRPASYYLEMNPGSANRAGSSLVRDIASADILILTTRYDVANEPNSSRVYGSDQPNKVVEEKFHLVWQSRSYRIYRHR